MNTLIANQYGRVQGEAGGCGLTLCVTAQTPRRESVELQTRVDSIEQQLHLLAILRAVERRIEQFQLRDGKAGESADQQSPFDETICGEEDLFRSNGTASKNKIYGRFSQFLVYEQVDQGRLRAFFAVRDDTNRVAGFPRRAINEEKTIPIKFGGEVNQLSLRRRNDGQVLAEFQHDGAMERIALSTLQLYELEVLTQYALHRAFEPPSFAAGSPLPPQTATAA